MTADPPIIPPEQDPFDQTLAAAKGGSRDAIEQMYVRLSKRLLNFVRSRRADDPEGVVNEVFLRVFTKLDTFEGSEPQFNAWVFAIARNQLIDQARRDMRRPVELSVASPDDGQPAAGDVAESALAAIETEALVAQLDVLTADQRDVVLLRIVADLTIDSIAETLGKPPGAIKALQRRAFRTLAVHLENPESGVSP